MEEKTQRYMCPSSVGRYESNLVWDFLDRLRADGTLLRLHSHVIHKLVEFMVEKKIRSRIVVCMMRDEGTDAFKISPGDNYRGELARHPWFVVLNWPGNPTKEDNELYELETLIDV